MAFCVECGTDIGSSKFCSECGTKVRGASNQISAPKKERKPLKEIDIAEFSDGDWCKIKLTSEKIYAKSIGLEETYALRSIDGSDAFNDMELFARQKLEAIKSVKMLKIQFILFIVIGVLSILLGLILYDKEGSWLMFLVALPFFILSYFKLKKSRNPLEGIELRSYIKLKVSGSDKLYFFDKRGVDIKKAEEFVQKVKETLIKHKSTSIVEEKSPIEILEKTANSSSGVGILVPLVIMCIIGLAIFNGVFEVQPKNNSAPTNNSYSKGDAAIQRGYLNSEYDVEFISNKLAQMGKSFLSIDVIGDYTYKVVDSDGKVWTLDYSKNH